MSHSYFKLNYLYMSMKKQNGPRVNSTKIFHLNKFLAKLDKVLSFKNKTNHLPLGDFAEQGAQHFLHFWEGQRTEFANFFFCLFHIKFNFSTKNILFTAWQIQKYIDLQSELQPKAALKLCKSCVLYFILIEIMSEPFSIFVLPPENDEIV